MQAMVKRLSYKNRDMCECEHWLYICLWEKNETTNAMWKQTLLMVLDSREDHSVSSGLLSSDQDHLLILFVSKQILLIWLIVNK